ncbi:MAG: hypothetical protein IKU25_09420 [Clostridia bacterium]|nr:hypothetical protein [Clostridia bacterium]
MKYYTEMIFEVTETCQNGNERKVKKSVFSPVYYPDGGGFLRYNYDSEIVSKAIEVLKRNNFHNIRHIKTKHTQLLFIDDFGGM